MDKQVLSTFSFDDYKINSMSFELNDEYNVEDDIEIDFKLGVSINISKDGKGAKVILSLGVFDDEENLHPFRLKASITGYFSTEDKIEKNKLVDFCKINATAILFPYLRAAVTDITKASNIQPLVLPLVNVYNLIVRSEKSLEESKK